MKMKTQIITKMQIILKIIKDKDMIVSQSNVHEFIQQKKSLSKLPIIEREAHDPRNMVKKGINWALRHFLRVTVRRFGKSLPNPS